jgi:fucose 4-O-acetylase-like acetyltransferase
MDAARGLGIILVVAGHAERGIVSAGIALSPAWKIFDIWLYTFHMPLFMLLAGLNIPASLAKGRRLFLESKGWTIVYPYFLWSLIQGGILLIFGGMTNGHLSWLQLLTIAWVPISPFWFLYALFIFSMIVLFMYNDYVLLIGATLGLFASSYVHGDSLLHQLLYQFSFFFIGVKSANYLKTTTLPRFTWLVCGVLWLVAVQFVPIQGLTPYLTPIAFPAGLAGIMTVLALAQACRGIILNGLAILGQASMAIYVMHILGTAGTRIALSKAHLALSGVAVWLVCIVVGVVGPLMVWWVLRRVNGLHWLGLASPAKRFHNHEAGSATADPAQRRH